MTSKEYLTSEKLYKRFDSQFNLVNYAIRLTENIIKTGRQPRVNTEIENPAIQSVLEIAAGTDQFDPIPEPQSTVATTQPEGKFQRFDERARRIETSPEKFTDVPVKKRDSTQKRKLRSTNALASRGESD